MPAKKKTQAAKPKPETAEPAKAAQPEPAQPVVAAAPVKAPAKGRPQIPGKPEPSWAKFNQGGGHAQKMMKGRPFRHQGR